MKQTLLLLFFVVLTFSIEAQFAYKPSTAAPEMEQLRVYPNPVINLLSFDNAAGKVNELVIYNLVGRPVQRFLTIKGKNTFDVSDLPKGMYLIQLIDPRGKVLITRRVNKR